LGPEATPAALRPVVVLLIVNLSLSIVLTVLVLIFRHSVIEYQLDHRHIVGAERDEVRHGYLVSLWVRVGGNILASVAYVFLVRALLRGQRWAYRRVITLGGVGILGLLLVLTTPYPPWMHVEQVLQALVLAALLYFVTRPEVRQHFAPDLPGRRTRRFRR
jgi:Na+-driven multidrug efflux pump